MVDLNMKGTFDATIVITTRNRKDELRQAIVSSLQQEGRNEVMVIDDGSTDGTTEFVKKEFPSVVLHRDETSRGYIVQRNRAARMASGAFVISIDDDARFGSPQTVRQTLAEFDDPRIGAVAIPFINVRTGDVVFQRAPDAKRCYVTASFVGTAYAVRRDLFNSVGGFREVFFHQGEEEDFCLRMFAFGYVTRLGNADPLHHFESPKRNLERMDLYGRRNNVLFAFLNVPLSALPAHLLGTTYGGLKYGWRVGRLVRMLRGLIAGYVACFKHKQLRLPVTVAAYRSWRHLRKQAMLNLSDLRQ